MNRVKCLPSAESLSQGTPVMRAFSTEAGFFAASGDPVVDLPCFASLTSSISTVSIRLGPSALAA